ncbi:Chromosome partition protein Smc [Carpediemonas membranifera]|uniref:Chromosome partition protein Smc n=1 Tax=Carpediemonas membranifera TaxID=201153 RepID=A0A8J6BWP0_9EUKA|nr:Chromosome partition protein Smc [Carpediemonas membranifera]|eukprot:KAG9392631.1 Chromosome partition protein Smc [Carpediemonas membranifera]
MATCDDTPTPLMLDAVRLRTRASAARRSHHAIPPPGCAGPTTPPGRPGGRTTPGQVDQFGGGNLSGSISPPNPQVWPMSVEERLQALENQVDETKEENAALRAQIELLEEQQNDLEDKPHSELIKKEFEAWERFQTEFKRDANGLPDDATLGDVIALVKNLVDFRLQYLLTLDRFGELTAKTFRVQAQGVTGKKALMEKSFKAAKMVGINKVTQEPKRVNKSFKQPAKMRCSFCNRPGHAATECWLKNPQLKK